MEIKISLEGERELKGDERSSPFLLGQMNT